MKKLIILFTAIPFLWGCEKDENNLPQEEETTATEQTLSIDAHLLWGGQLANLNDTLTVPDASSGEDTLLITHFGIYLNNFQLIRTDGFVVDVDSLKGTPTAVLLTKDRLIGNMGKLPVGSYSGFRFQIGSEPMGSDSDNSGNSDRVQPTDYSAGHPLGPQSPGMWWSWNSGYIFARVDGFVDTDGNGSFSDDQQLVMHLGTDNMVMHVTTFEDEAFIIDANIGGTLHMNIDLKTLFDGLNIKSENVTHTMDNMPMANKVKANIPNAFSKEQ